MALGISFIFSFLMSESAFTCYKFLWFVSETIDLFSTKQVFYEPKFGSIKELLCKPDLNVDTRATISWQLQKKGPLWDKIYTMDWTRTYTSVRSDKFLFYRRLFVVVAVMCSNINQQILFLSCDTVHLLHSIFSPVWCRQSADDTPLAFRATRSGWWMNDKAFTILNPRSFVVIFFNYGC